MIDKNSLKEELLKENIFRADGRLNPAWLKWKAPQHDLSSLEGDSLQEKIYLLFHERKYCQICGKPTIFRNFTSAYPDTCSPECKKKYDAMILRTKASPKLKSKEVQEKRKETCLKKYGVDNVFKSPEIKASIKNTLVEKYGVEHPAQNKELVEKSKETSLQRYGVEYYTQSEEYRVRSKKAASIKIESFERENDCLEVQKIIDKYGQGWLSLELPCLSFGKYRFIENKYIPKIEKHFEEFQNNRTHAEVEIEEFCRELLPDESILVNTRNVIKSSSGRALELDIYIPSKKVAIEYNGIYRHSLNDKDYYLYKTQECAKLGIRLIHIWEDLWFSKKDIYKSIIASSLGCYQTRIYARKCTVEKMDSTTYKEFLNKNHIQGSVNTSSIRLGLFYNGEIVQVIGRGKSRFKKDEFELPRMCTKLNTQVIGGFSKLISSSNIPSFISYVSRDIFSGDGYFKLGFKTVGYTEPGYFYCDNKLNRINRMSAQKHLLEKLLPTFDKNLTEVENMKNNGYLQIFDCGNIKVSWSRD